MRPNSGAVAIEVRCVVDFAEGLLRFGDLPGPFSVGCLGGLVLVWYGAGHCSGLFWFRLWNGGTVMHNGSVVPTVLRSGMGWR